MDAHASSELQMILERYDLGELVDFDPDERGTINTSYSIETVKSGQRKRYFFRRYKSGVHAEELLFEHSIINHLVSSDFDIVAGVVPTKDGSSFAHISAEETDRNGVFYAIFDFLPGEDRYIWIDPVCTPPEISSAANVLAKFHRTLYGFMPSGARVEQRIMDLLPVVDEHLDQCASQAKGTVFDSYFWENLPVIRQNLMDTQIFLENSLGERCAELVIHCDYHPGNLKFSGDHVIGVFDLDWSKVDYRCFDVALAIYYFSTSWGETRDGELRLAEVQLFLDTYQNALAGEFQPGQMTSEELRCLPAMIAAANLYVLNWAILDYIHKDVDPAEYLVVLKHSVQTINWLEDGKNLSALNNLIRQLGGQM